MNGWRSWRGGRAGREMGASDALLQAQAGEMQALAGFAQAFAGICGAGAVVWAANVAGKTFGSTLETQRAEAAFSIARRAIAFAAKASSVYSHIRSPFSPAGEGSTREKKEPETEAEALERDADFVIFERIQFHQDYWKDGLELQWEAEAVFGQVFGDAVREILIQRNKIAVRWRIQRRYTRQERPLNEATINLLKEAENMIWEGVETPDTFGLHLETQQRLIIDGLKQFVSLENSKLIQIPVTQPPQPWWERTSR